jgi:molybdopterin-guanine dinucleotide biosynthesis protein A
MNAGDVTGLILAGGRAVRMGGVAKGLLLLNGKTLVEHVAARLGPQVATMLLSANRPDYNACGLPVVADAITGHVGPLAGLHAGLLACATPWLVTAPCDAPFLPTDLVDRLAKAADEHSLCVAASPSGIEPGFILCHVGLAHDLGRWLQNGGRRVQDWLRAAGAVAIPFDDAAAFANINTPDDLARH